MSEYHYAYYYGLKTVAREAVSTSLNERIRLSETALHWRNLTLCSIDKRALDFARLEWPKYYGDETHRGFIVSWEKLYHRFSNRPSYFDLAVWQKVGDENILQGLALGKPSAGKTHLVINWVERSFAPTYLLKGILIPILACAEEYGKLLGARRVLIKDAVDPAQYGRYGYDPYSLLKRPGNYLMKEL